MTETLAGSRADLPSLLERDTVHPRQYGVALLCAALALVDGFDSQVIAFAAPVMAPDFGTTAPNFGAVLGAGMIGSLIAVFLQGAIGDRFGRKPVIVGSFIFVALATLATVLATSLPQLVVLRFLAGLGIGAALPNLLAITSDYAPARRRFVFVTAVFTGLPFGAVLGGAISAWLLSAFGWHAVFWLGGISALLLVPVAIFYLPESLSFLAGRPSSAAALRRTLGSIGIDIGSETVITDRSDTDSAALSVRQLFTDGRAAGTALLWIISFSSLVVSIFIVNWLPTILSEAGVTISSAVIGSVILQGGGIIGSLTVSALIDRIGHRPMIIAYVIGAGTLALIALLPLSGNAVLVALFLTGLFFIGGQMCIASLATFQYPGRLRAKGVGWAIGVGRIGGIVGTLIGGILLARQVDAADLFIVAAIIVLGVAFALTRLTLPAGAKPAAATKHEPFIHSAAAEVQS